MSFFLRLCFLLLVVGLPACGGETSPLLRKVDLIHPDGSVVALADSDLSPFQRMLRSRIPWPEPKPRLEAIFAAEVDVPEGEGNEGEYLAVLGAGKTGELRYFEQVEHQPRIDRYFHRALSAEEWREFSGFLLSHPLMGYRPLQGDSESEPAGQGQETGAATRNQAVDFEMLLTDAQRKTAHMIEVKGAALEQPEARGLVQLLHRLRDADGLTCSYYQPIPPNSRLLFGEPFRAALGVWAKGDDVRAVVSPPWHPLDAVPTTAPEPRWMALKDERWTVGEAPPPPPPEPETTTPAASTATLPVAPAIPGAALIPPDIGATGEQTAHAGAQSATPATRPSPFSETDILPKEEYWTAEPRGNFTAVTHYIPINAFHAERVEFWVPTFQFDEEHMWVDAPRGILYLIHDGQLFALPIPPAALSAH